MSRHDNIVLQFDVWPLWCLSVNMGQKIQWKREKNMQVNSPAICHSISAVRTDAQDEVANCLQKDFLLLTTYYLLLTTYSLNVGDKTVELGVVL